jgi:hypothetical protein
MATRAEAAAMMMARSWNLRFPTMTFKFSSTVASSGLAPSSFTPDIYLLSMCSSTELHVVFHILSSLPVGKDGVRMRMRQLRQVPLGAELELPHAALLKTRGEAERAGWRSRADTSCGSEVSNGGENG